MISLKGTLKERDIFYERTGQLLLLTFAVFLLIRAFLGQMWYAEIDSNALPLISIQYRGSILMNQSDLIRAQADFPSLYAGISTYENLRSAKLIQVAGGWLSWYFPIYPLICLPVKLLLTACRVDQERCFFVTNALLITTALWFVYRKLNVSYRQRLLAMVLLILSPIIYYNNYLCYEAFIFSMLTISLVEYYSGHLKISAFLLALAGMSNSTVMAVGIVMIAEYFINMFRREQAYSFAEIVKRNFRETVIYGLCFAPCLAPLLVQRIYTGGSVFANAVSFSNYATRFLSYLFDPTLGFFSFAVIELLLFFILAAIAICRKNLRALPWLFFLLSTVAAFSLMYHINCGMIFCARYLVWTYPIIPLFLATVGDSVLRSIVWKRILYSATILSTGALLFVNSSSALDPHSFNPVTKQILEIAPMLYNPYSATFYCRTLHIDGAYDHTEPAYYVSPETEKVRKLIFKAEPAEAETILNDLTGSDEAVAELRVQLGKIGTDGEFHYLNFPAEGAVQLREKTSKEENVLKEGDVLVEARSFNLQTNGSYQEFIQPLTIRKNTTYKIELTLPENFDFLAPEDFFVDFYAPTYDNAEQEADQFLQEGRYSYTFYFNSGSFGGNTLDVSTRIIDFTKESSGALAGIKQFQVTEMLKP